MKRLIFAGFLCAGLVANASATVIVYDNFDYADGSLVGNGGWANHSGILGDMLVSSGQVVVQHGTPSEDANVAFSAVSGTIYYGIDFSVGNLGAPYTAGGDYEYFAHFREGFNFSGRLDIVPPSSSGDFSVGISSQSSTAEAVWATDLSYDTFYRAVVGYDQDANIAELWINPAVAGDTSILGADGTDPGDTVVSFALRQSDSTENETVFVDNLVVGTTFEDVVTAVPEPGTLALLGLGGLLTALRRRR